MKKNSQSGFTLIELLVVIAIIGILASVVLASLNSARNKGADAAIKANLANARAQAELFYDNTNQTYTAVCTAAGGIGSLVTQAATTAGTTLDTDPATVQTTLGECQASATAWAAQVPVKAAPAATGFTGLDFYCVDSTGKSVVEDAPMAINAFACI